LALLFLYHHVLQQDLLLPIDAPRAKKPKRLPAVLAREEVCRVLSYMSGTHQLMAHLLYGSGLRSVDPRFGLIRRHHVGKSGLQKVSPHWRDPPPPTAGGLS